nr:leucine-rich repeat domain-containing protein [uncultured Prevotella sp.]
MKKVLFTSILLLSAVSFGGNIYAQDTAGGNNTEVTTPSATQPSVKFTADGNTLTISGQGDLTSYMTTDWSAKVFTDKAVGFVFTDDKGTKVNAKDSYNSGKTYYKADYKYTQIFDGGLPTQSNGFGAVNTVFDETKISNLYSGYHDNNGNIKIEKKVQTSDNPKILGDVTWTYEGKEYYNYFTCDEELSDGTTIALTDLKTKKVGLLDKAGLFGHLKVTYEVYDGKSLFVKHAGSDEKTTLVANKTYIYKSGDLFYEGTATYAAIKDNNAFFDKHTDYVQADNTEISFKELLRRKILEGVSVYDYNAKKEVGVSSYTTVKFVNNGSDPLLIDADVVRGILYPTSNGMLTTNVTTTKLDLGEATLNELNADIFIPSQNESYKCHKLALNDITFPKTKLTLVFSESTKHDENKMVLPAQLLSNITRYIKTVSIPEGYDRIADGAFSNENKQSVLENVNLPKGLTLIGKNAFQNCNYIKSIELNEGLENIGDSAFFGTTLGTVKFPSSLKIINDCAFANCHIYNLKFNAGLKYIGNSAFALSNEHTEEVLEIPASVIYIGPYAFNFRQYQDVYFYGEKAPLMPLGSYKLDATKDLGTAFPQQTLNGNNGFDPLPKEGEEKTGDDTSSGYANRENYKNHGVYLCMLHYPKELSDENRDTYTDITRVYKTYRTADGKFIATDIGTDEATDKVGKEEKDEILNAGLCHSFKKVTWGYADTYLGEQYIWPSHSQFNRAYCTASHSVKWDGVTPVTCDLSAEEIAALKYAGYDTSESNLDELKKIAHMGTRQFVLANADAFVDDKPEEEPTYPINIKGGQWWTICVPFDMTKAQVDNVFGKDTHVCRFNKVERVVNSEKKEKSIKLFFTNDVYVHKSTKDKDGNYTTSTGTPVADDDIVIYAHESYMIYPTKNNDDANNMYNISNYTLVTGSPLPTLVEATEQFIGGAKESASGDASWNKEYRFVGNYQTAVAVAASEQGNSSEETVARDMKNVTVPQYSYIYAQKKGTSKAQFWFYTGKEMLWGANKCVVQATARDGGKSDFNTYFGGNGSARAKELSFFGTDDEVTGIENVEIIAGNENDTQIVYNLNGQVVNGNLNSLQKGIYIKNGKKFMVK